MSALDAAVAVARAHGLPCHDAVVLRAHWHVIVHLAPSPVIARVSSGELNIPHDDIGRELDIARLAAAGGAPVVRPSTLLDPGPHEHAGRTMVFWEFAESRGEVDPAAAGRGLRAIHEALESCDLPLPTAGRREDVHEMLDRAPPSTDVELLRELVDIELPTGQALHGDAHLWNCIQTAEGPLWHDFETTCRGPREFDLAALVHAQRAYNEHPAADIALAAYGPYDKHLLELALPVYAAWVAASWLDAVSRRPEAAVAVERQLTFLRSYRR